MVLFTKVDLSGVQPKPKCVLYDVSLELSNSLIGQIRIGGYSDARVKKYIKVRTHRSEESFEFPFNEVQVLSGRMALTLTGCLSMIAILTMAGCKIT